ncbi:MAG: ABC transporter permease [Dehalococcoidia bacterium]|nr:ABC transporter permease [Dehalococcoidia bacterium]
MASLDPDVYKIAWRSLWIALTSSAIAFFFIALPFGSLIHFNNFPGKTALITLIQTLFSLPTVAVGLIVWVVFTRSGPLGSLDLMFTPKIMVIGQAILVTPVMLGLVISALRGVDKAVPETAAALGANSLQSSIITIREAQFGIMTALVLGFGRAVSEVGVAMMVGGNIDGYTRTLTTAITLETSRAETELALALGFILIFIAVFVNVGLLLISKRRGPIGWLLSNS